MSLEVPLKAMVYERVPSFAICAWAYDPKTINKIRLNVKIIVILLMVHLHLLSPEYQGKMLNGLRFFLDKKNEVEEPPIGRTESLLEASSRHF
jgi:hypothetical protein